MSSEVTVIDNQVIVLVIVIYYIDLGGISNSNILH